MANIWNGLSEGYTILHKFGTTGNYTPAPSGSPAQATCVNVIIPKGTWKVDMTSWFGNNDNSVNFNYTYLYLYNNTTSKLYNYSTTGGDFFPPIFQQAASAYGAANMSTHHASGVIELSADSELTLRQNCSSAAPVGLSYARTDVIFKKIGSFIRI